MADIRVERKAGSKMWFWVLLALVVLALALYVLYQEGYIGGVALPADPTEVQSAPLTRLASDVLSQLKEAFHG
jgi:hypothetical protein